MSCGERTRRHRSYPAARAFTLIELAILVLIVGIMGMAGVPAMVGAVNAARLNAAAAAVVDALEVARLSAMTTGRATQVTVSATTGRIQVLQTTPAQFARMLDVSLAALPSSDVEQEVWSPMPHPYVRGRNYDVGLDGGARIASSVFGSGNTVQFNAYGVPTSAGLVIVACGGLRAEVRLDARSGHVTVQ